jgi:hypothetical protein
MTYFGELQLVQDLQDGKRVKLAIKKADMTGDIGETLTDTRARARAMVAAGFAEEGFLRKPDLAMKLPRLERRTDIENKKKAGSERVYSIRVRGGVVLK